MAPTVAEPTVAEPSTENKTNLAPQWKVFIHDDDKTTFEFVIWLLVTIFQKKTQEAVRLTFEVHENGLALVTVVHKERAELYVEQVRSTARARKFPLTASMEPA